MAAESPARLKLTMFPAELLLRIYEVLPSFADAFALSATCRTLHYTWKEHRTAIVHGIISHFEGYLYAQELLASEGNGPPVEQSDLADRHLLTLARYAKRIEQAVEGIEQNDIPKLRSTFSPSGRLHLSACPHFVIVDGLPESKRSTIYGGSATHPPKLTQPERFRVVRALYQVWMLAHPDRDYVRAKLAPLPLRQKYYIAGLSVWALPNEFPTGDRWETLQIRKAIGRLRENLAQDGYFTDSMKLVTIWDHWQDNLKSIVCGRPFSDLRRDAKAREMAHLWDYESGDEFFVEEDDVAGVTG
jgi:hypothetical protein